MVVGGSQGSLSINRAVINALEIFDKKSTTIQVLFQTGDKGYEEIKEISKTFKTVKIIVNPYLYRIEKAYACADLVISRAGAISAL